MQCQFGTVQRRQPPRRRVTAAAGRRAAALAECLTGSISKHTKSYHTIIKTYKIVTYNAQNLQNRPGRGQSKHTKAQHTKSCHTKSQGTKSFHTKRQWKINGINQSTHHTKPFHINLHHFVVLEMSIFSWIKTYNLIALQATSLLEVCVVTKYSTRCLLCQSTAKLCTASVFCLFIQ